MTTRSSFSPVRRHWLGAAIGLAAAPATGLLGGCAALNGPAVTGSKVAEGVYRMRLGDATITAISDGFVVRKGLEGLVRNAAVDEVNQALREAGLPTDQITLTYTAFLVETGGQRILIDTGHGEFGAPTTGRVAAGLQAAGVSRESIDTILISHFHGDHINGLRDKSGALVYPKARIHVPQPEWAYWMNDANMARAPEAMQRVFQAPRRVFGPIASQLNRFEPGSEIVAGLRSMPAYGHTPGHTAFSLQAGGRTWAFLADFAVAQLFVRNPDWSIAFDIDADAARATRRRLLEEAIAGNWLVSGYHMPFPAIGTISRRGKGYEFTPLS